MFPAMPLHPFDCSLSTLLSHPVAAAAAAPAPDMSITELFGYLAGALTTFAFIPQVARLYKLKHSRDISLPTFSMFAMGVLCWLIYGLLLPSLPIILWNAITLGLALAVVALTIRYRARPRPVGPNPGGGPIE